MLLDICFGSKSAWRILLILSSPPGRGLTREEIRKFTKLGSKMLTEKLKILQEFDIITSNKVGRKTFYRLNISSEFTEKILELCRMEIKELNKLDFGLSIAVREFARQVLESINVASIFIFGSYVKRTFHKGSDIDIAIITKEKLNTGGLLLIENACENTEKRFGRKIQTHVFSKEEFDFLKKKKDKLAEEILRDGLELV
ncbi:MAG: nucleotidyltransferase domain-containing protein [Candidatus Aenigmarchaeota archaeon]|nr:nucleotidyltransferase domain-containing protein [Candidatus Aenigmarchaeota archaeon]